MGGSTTRTPTGRDQGSALLDPSLRVVAQRHHPQGDPTGVRPLQRGQSSERLGGGRRRIPMMCLGNSVDSMGRGRRAEPREDKHLVAPEVMDTVGSATTTRKLHVDTSKLVRPTVHTTVEGHGHRAFDIDENLTTTHAPGRWTRPVHEGEPSSL